MFAKPPEMIRLLVRTPKPCLLIGAFLWLWDRLDQRLEPMYRRESLREAWKKESAQGWVWLNHKRPRLFWNFYLLFAGIDGFETDLRQAWYDKLDKNGEIVEVNIFVGKESTFVPIRIDGPGSAAPASVVLGNPALGSAANSSTASIAQRSSHSTEPSRVTVNASGSTPSENAGPASAAASLTAGVVAGSVQRSAPGTAGNNPFDAAQAAVVHDPLNSLASDDATTFEQLRMWFYWMQFKRGLVEIVLPKELKRIDMVKRSGDLKAPVLGDRIETLQLGRYGESLVAGFLDPKKLESSQQVAVATITRKPRDEGVEFVRVWNRNVISIISMMPFLLSLVFAALWMGISIGKFHVDAQVAVQTAFTVAGFIVTAGALLIALFAFLDTQAAT